KKVNHPAPFPVELPARCIQLYTYSNDVVLDPFMGSGTTAVAAQDAGRNWVGYEISPEYIAVSRERLGLQPEQHEPGSPASTSPI
ncbi:MAG: site-specific DNA-methyltransferase, partial [Caldilineaceae bacterium SB0675_bin_29]|nr:site-specific DNA-methyltransferase [Caldilineaceae bacterium SB0675_bin_29]